MYIIKNDFIFVCSHLTPEKGKSKKKKRKKGKYSRETGYEVNYFLKDGSIYSSFVPT